MSDEKIYKVTAAKVAKTKQGHDLFRIQLNGQIWVSKFVPNKPVEQKFCSLYKHYANNNKNLNFLTDKYISIAISEGEYGYSFYTIGSIDVIRDFKDQVDRSKGKAFFTKLPIFEFLASKNRTIETDGSIKITSDRGDMRISILNRANICHQYDESNLLLNLVNINIIFEKFYKGVELPNDDPLHHSSSYYTISTEALGIVRMDNQVNISLTMTKSGDYDKWVATPILKIGDQLSEEQIMYLNAILPHNCQKTPPEQLLSR